MLTIVGLVMSRKLILYTVLFSFFLWPAGTLAEVYKWEDAQGKVHYTSKPPSPDAKPAKLPPITRGDVKLAPVKLVSCDQRGGVNCQLGPDVDGSVICYDGFREASARFRFTCSSPKLEVTDISELTPEGSFVVYVRNAKSVAAAKPIVTFTGSANKEIQLIGPQEIAPFGMGEFVFQPPLGAKLAKKPSHEQLVVACANCP